MVWLRLTHVKMTLPGRRPIETPANGTADSRPINMGVANPAGAAKISGGRGDSGWSFL